MGYINRMVDDGDLKSNKELNKVLKVLKNEEEKEEPESHEEENQPDDETPEDTETFFEDEEDKSELDREKMKEALFESNDKKSITKDVKKTSQKQTVFGEDTSESNNNTNENESVKDSTKDTPESLFIPKREQRVKEKKEVEEEPEEEVDENNSNIDFGEDEDFEEDDESESEDEEELDEAEEDEGFEEDYDGDFGFNNKKEQPKADFDLDSFVKKEPIKKHQKEEEESEEKENPTSKRFLDNLKSKRRSFWDTETEEEEEVELEPKKEHKKESFQKEAEEFVSNFEKASSMLSFGSKSKKSTSEKSIHYSFAPMLDKMVRLGFDKEEAKEIISLSPSTLNKIASLFTTYGISNNQILLFSKIQEVLIGLQNENFDTSFLKDLFLGKPVVINLSVISKIDPKEMKLNFVNFGLIPSSLVGRVKAEDLELFLKKTKRKFFFKAYTKNTKKINGLLIPLNTYKKSNNDYITIFSKLGFTLHENELVYILLGKDDSRNKFILLIK